MITDVMMPGMDGRALAARLRHHHPETRILFVSGYAAGASGPTPMSEHQQPAHPWLEKPFTIEELARAVRDTLDA